MTKQDKLFLYKTALEYIVEGKETHAGLCWLFDKICIENQIIIDMYRHLKLEEEYGLFGKPSYIGGFEELTDQMIGKPYSGYWFSTIDWESRKQLLLNAINILENENNS